MRVVRVAVAMSLLSAAVPFVVAQTPVAKPVVAKPTAGPAAVTEDGSPVPASPFAAGASDEGRAGVEGNPCGGSKVA